jgi:hypothetical protein
VSLSRRQTQKRARLLRRRRLAKQAQKALEALKAEPRSGPDFNVILSDPAIRKVVQEGILEKAFHTSVFPTLTYKPKKG